jgi:hypothetical protein
MGVRACEEGVTLRFLDETGKNEVRNPVRGEFAYFFSKTRPESPNDPDPVYGSASWLTDVIVVDNPLKLTTMKPSPQSNIDFTSASSKRVLVRWSVEPETDSAAGCFTISTGHQKTDTGYLYADTVYVMPASTKMDDKHFLWSLWRKMCTKLYGPPISQPFETFKAK